MAHDFDFHSAALDRVRMEGFTLADSLAAAHQDQEQRTHTLALQNNQSESSSSFGSSAPVQAQGTRGNRKPKRTQGPQVKYSNSR